jgi:cell wall-associated NlpC family hydrolase
MPSPALSAAAALTKLSNPIGTGRPATASSPNARHSPTAGIPSSFSDILALAGAQSAVSGAASSVTSAASSKAQRAVAWAKSMVGRQDWNNLCERFVEEAYGARNAFPNAISAAKQLVTHKGSSSLRTAPVGALLYFAADETNEGHGHAAIYLGKGEMISARPDGVKVERVDTPYNRDRYIGWGSAPSKFSGRKTTIPAARSVPTSGSSLSTPGPSPAPLVPPRLPR